MKNDIIYYSVGALLYCPANKKTIADSVIHEKFGTKYSLALCLEDTINDNYVTEAEQDLISSIHQIFESFQDHPFYLPKIFIRVRNAGQIERLTKAFGESIKVITGYIIPKFTADNASSYIEEMIRANELRIFEIFGFQYPRTFSCTFRLSALPYQFEHVPRRYTAFSYS